MRFQFWRDAVDLVFAGTPPKHPAALCLADTVARHPLSREDAEMLVLARRRDAAGSGFQTLNDLATYSDETAGSLLRLVLACTTEFEQPPSTEAELKAAGHLGRAIGLATALKATPFVIGSGEVRLPLEVIENAGADVTDLRRGIMTDELCEAAFIVAKEAQAHLELAREVTGISKRAARAFLPAIGCGRYLSVLERRGFDLFHPEARMPDGGIPFALAKAVFRGSF